MEYSIICPRLDLSGSKSFFLQFFLLIENGLKWIENVEIFFVKQFENQYFQILGKKCSSHFSVD